MQDDSSVDMSATAGTVHGSRHNTNVLRQYMREIVSKKLVKYGYEEQVGLSLAPIERDAAVAYVERGGDSSLLFANNQNELFIAIDPFSHLLGHRLSIVGGYARAFMVADHIVEHASHPLNHASMLLATSVVKGDAVVGIDTEQLVAIRALTDKLCDKREKLSILFHSPELTQYYLANVLNLHGQHIASIMSIAPHFHDHGIDDAAMRITDIIGASPQHIHTAMYIAQYFMARRLSDLPDPLKAHPAVLRMHELEAMAYQIGYEKASYRPDVLLHTAQFSRVHYCIKIGQSRRTTVAWGGRLSDYYGASASNNLTGMQINIDALSEYVTPRITQQAYTQKIDAIAIVDTDVLDTATPYIEQLRRYGLSVVMTFDQSVADGLYIVLFDKKGISHERFDLVHPVTGKVQAHSLERIVSIVQDYRK